MKGIPGPVSAYGPTAATEGERQKHVVRAITMRSIGSMHSQDEWTVARAERFLIGYARWTHLPWGEEAYEALVEDQADLPKWDAMVRLLASSDSMREYVQPLIPSDCS
jgi:hypothetical protein